MSILCLSGKNVVFRYDCFYLGNMMFQDNIIIHDYFVYLGLKCKSCNIACQCQ